MAEPIPQRRPLTGGRLALAALGLASVYAALYKLIEVEADFGSPFGAALWPAAGITVSVLILRPRREWPTYLAAVLVTETLMDVQAGFSPAVSVGMGVANTVEPLIGAHLLRAHTDDGPDLSRLHDLGWFLLGAVLVGPAVGALLGSLWPWIIGVDPIWPRLGRWFVGDAVGVLAIAPVILSLARTAPRPPVRLGESWAAVLLAAVALLALPWTWTSDVGLPFLVIPALTLVGIQLGTRAAAIGVLLVSALVEVVTALGGGPFAQEGPFDGLLAVQVYLATCSIAALTAAALMAGLTSRYELAMRDSLTGLANRRALLDRLGVACRHLARSGGAVGLVFVDLDRFKEINDRYGHAAGDAVLRETGARLRDTVRDQDTVARLGGDEFIVLVDGLAEEEEEGLDELVERITRVVAEPIRVSASAAVQVGASLGHVVSREAVEDPEELLRRADREMYVAKRAQRASG